MFDDYTEEHLSSWDDPDVIEWKKTAIEILKHYYLAFAGRQWDEYEMPTERNLLRAKLCYALFGPPTDEAENIEDAYNEEQKKRAGEIIGQILQVCDPNNKALKVGFIFVACKQKENQFVLPVFSVFGGLDAKENELHRYVDSQGRTYQSWNDWETENTLPMLKYAYPAKGFFTCSQDWIYQFDPNQDPVVKYGTSPRCDISKRILNQTDLVSGITALGSGLLFAASMFTPVGPAVLLGSAIAGGASAVYGTGRAVVRLVDKGQHGESLSDFESITLYLGIAAMPFHFATSAINATLIRGATINGRIFSGSMRMFATILNFTTLGLDAGLLVSSLVNLIEKTKNRQLTVLDCLQFSMSVFFFSHTLIQPKVARGIIEKAQNQHIDNYMKSMSDAEVQATFKQFVDQNRGEGTITDNSKIVRAINRINDPNGFFKGMDGAADMKIGGRKGKTVLVTDHHGNTNRLNPNRVLFEQSTQGTVNFQKNYVKLQKCLGDPEKVELNGEKIFQYLDDRQKARVGRVYGTCDKGVAETALEIAKSMNYKSADELMSITEIVAAEVKGKKGANLSTALNDIRGKGQCDFIKNIKADLKAAMKCAESANLKFEDPLKAVYHYRKHGQEFPTKIMSNKIDYYLGEVPGKIIQDSNLKLVQKLQDGTVRKFYVDSHDNFGIVTETPTQRKISSLYRRLNQYENFAAKLAENHANVNKPAEPVDVTARNIGQAMGFGSLEINLAIGSGKNPKPIVVNNVDEDVHKEIAEQLAALHDILSCGGDNEE